MLKSNHILFCFHYLEESTGALNVEQDVGEGSDGVGVPPHHHVRKADVVVHRDLATGNARVQTLLVQLDVLKDLQAI